MVGAEEEEEEEGEEEEEEEEGRVKSGRVEEMRDRHNRNDIRRCREKVWSVWKWCGCGVDVDVEVESLWMWMDVGENWCRISLRGTREDAMMQQGAWVRHRSEHRQRWDSIRPRATTG